MRTCTRTRTKTTGEQRRSPAAYGFLANPPPPGLGVTEPGPGDGAEGDWGLSEAAVAYRCGRQTCRCLTGTDEALKVFTVLDASLKSQNVSEEDTEQKRSESTPPCW